MRISFFNAKRLEHEQKIDLHPAQKVFSAHIYRELCHESLLEPQIYGKEITFINNVQNNFIFYFPDLLIKNKVYFQKITYAKKKSYFQELSQIFTTTHKTLLIIHNLNKKN